MVLLVLRFATLFESAASLLGCFALFSFLGIVFLEVYVTKHVSSDDINTDTV